MGGNDMWIYMCIYMYITIYISQYVCGYVCPSSYRYKVLILNLDYDGFELMMNLLVPNNCNVNFVASQPLNMNLHKILIDFIQVPVFSCHLLLFLMFEVMGLLECF